MKIKGAVFIATSVDGYIARKDGTLDWLEDIQASIPEGEDCGFIKFLASVDALVMGRKTFEQVLSFGEWAYGKTPVIVLSHHKLEIPEDLVETVSCSAETPMEILQRLEREGAKKIYIDGGAVIQSFLNDGLINEMTITQVPVAIGEGIPLFKGHKKDIKLNLLHSKIYDFGFVQTTYCVHYPSL